MRTNWTIYQRRPPPRRKTKGTLTPQIRRGSFHKKVHTCPFNKRFCRKSFLRWYPCSQFPSTVKSTSLMEPGPGLGSRATAKEPQPAAALSLDTEQFEVCDSFYQSRVLCGHFPARVLTQLDPLQRSRKKRCDPSSTSTHPPAFENNFRHSLRAHMLLCMHYAQPHRHSYCVPVSQKRKLRPRGER